MAHEAAVSKTFDLPGFSGELLRPDHADYDEARTVFNAMIDRRPVLIARCANADDVVAAVNLAREQRLPLSVYGGGHGLTGSAVADAGVCVDLRGMKRIKIEVEGQTARVEGGVTWSELDAATQEYGLAVTGGRVGTTGVSGLTLGSGSGWLERKFGFTCDSLLSAELVTADGRKVTASEDENPELFWGLRGGGGNFGVVTAFNFQLHEVGPILLGGMLIHPAERAGELTRFFRDYMADAPDEVGAAIAYITAPPADFVPEPARGKPVAGVVVCYVGDPDEGEEVIRPLREFGPPAVDMVQPMPYVALQGMLEPANPKGLQNYWSAHFLAELPDEAVDVLVGKATQPVSPMTQIILMPGGGALSRVPEDATAFGERRSPFNVHYLSMWPDPADSETNIAYTRDIAGAMDQWTTGRAYLNFLGDEGVGRVEAAFGTEKYRRLQALKDVWDPENLFRHNQNIPPTAG
jgi:FAD/FMN-containing dehydrogenase